MKKILSFLFAFFLISINANAATNEIIINQHASGFQYSSSVIGTTNITSNKYHLYKDNVLKGSYSNSISISNAELGSYHIIEEGQSYGYYPYTNFDYNFELTKTCPKIMIDIEKKLINETVAIENKNNIKLNISIFNSDNKRISFFQNNLSYQELLLNYDDYNFMINGRSILININDEVYNNPILFEDDSYLIKLIPRDTKTLEEPKITIIKSCFNDEGILISNEFTYIKEDLNETIEVDNKIIDDSIETKEIIDKDISNELSIKDVSIDVNEIEDVNQIEDIIVLDIDSIPLIGNELVIEDGLVEETIKNNLEMSQLVYDEDIVTIKPSLKNINVINKVGSSSEEMFCSIENKLDISENEYQDTDDLIIEYVKTSTEDNLVKRKKIGKSSIIVLPLFSLILAILWFKKYKKVQKK